MQEIVISLAPGQAGFYDELTGIHLNLSNKEARVPYSANTMGLIKAVKSGKILVVSGSLGLETVDYVEANRVPPTYYRLLSNEQKQFINTAAFVVEQQKINEDNAIIEIEKTVDIQEEVEPTVMIFSSTEENIENVENVETEKTTQTKNKKTGRKKK